MDERRTCRNCGKKLIEKQTRKTAEQLKKPYYYTAYYYCSNCNKLYHDEKFKVINPQTTPLQFDKLTLAHLGPVSMQGAYDVEIWTDGACVSNGTPNAKAAWAFVSGKTERAGRIEGKQTNNIAEGMAIYQALLWAAEKGYKKVLLYTDSQISLFNLKKPASKVIANREIFENIEKVIAEYKLEVDYQKVLGHSGEPNNERADALANGLAAKA
jgi:ribonuclease HI